MKPFVTALAACLLLAGALSACAPADNTGNNGTGNTGTNETGMDRNNGTYDTQNPTGTTNRMNWNQTREYNPLDVDNDGVIDDRFQRRDNNPPRYPSTYRDDGRLIEPDMADRDRVNRGVLGEALD